MNELHCKVLSLEFLPQKGQTELFLSGEGSQALEDGKQSEREKTRSQSGQGPGTIQKLER